MKIALVEDNGLHQAQIRQEIQNYFDELNEVCELRVFDNGSDMLDHYYSVGGYDLLLLDIQLPGMDGISVARQVRQKDDKVLIAFITSMTAYAVQGLQRLRDGLHSQANQPHQLPQHAGPGQGTVSPAHGTLYFCHHRGRDV